ncbi:MAG: porin [Rhodanobacter sp.]
MSAAYDDHGDLDGKFQGHGYSGRVVYAPVDDKTHVVHIGMAASREFPQDRSVQFSSTPEAGLTQTALVNTGKLLGTRSIDRTGVEAGWMSGPLYAQGEYLRFSANRDAGLTRLTGNGFYVLGAWMLTGESRKYKDSYFVNTAPAHAYGAFELALRYSELDLNDGGVVGGRQHDWTLGVNRYIGQQLKLQADYVRAYANQSPANAYVAPVDPQVLEVRAQVCF